MHLIIKPIETLKYYLMRNDKKFCQKDFSFFLEYNTVFIYSLLPLNGETNACGNFI